MALKVRINQSFFPQCREQAMRVLIIDDNKIMRRIIQRTLRHAGYGDVEFTEATNGVQAYKIICDERPDLVVSNWNVPQLSGIDLLRRLRAEANDTKFGFVSAYGCSVVARKEASDAGALFMLPKPLTVEALRFEMAKMLT